MEFSSRAVRSLAELHERELRAFLTTWRRFEAAGLPLPEAHGDDSYVDRPTLLTHVLRAGLGYLIWIGEVLGRPVADVDAGREPGKIAPRAEAYVEEVIAAWRRHLLRVTDAELGPAAYKSRWGDLFTIDQMLEHAVVHPMRHRIQLERLMRG